MKNDRATHTFLYAGKQLTVLEIANLILPGTGQQPSPVLLTSTTPRSPEAPLQSKAVAGPRKDLSAGYHQKLEGYQAYLWNLCVIKRLASCWQDQHEVEFGECKRCLKACNAAGLK